MLFAVLFSFLPHIRRLFSVLSLAASEQWIQRKTGAQREIQSQVMDFNFAVIVL